MTKTPLKRCPQCKKEWPKSRPVRQRFCGKACYAEFLKTVVGRDKHTYHHGMSKTPFYIKWRSMMQRCNDKKREKYPIYGGRGIAVCDEWKQFEFFFRDMYESYNRHLKQHGRQNTTLDRIDVNGNYEKSNCRWATCREQAFNRRGRKGKEKKLLTHSGKTQSIIAWADELGIKRTTLHMRIHKYGWTSERALNT